MRRTLSALFALAVLATLVILGMISQPISKRVVPTVHASGCSNATLTGIYAFTLPGWATPPPKNGTDGKSSIPGAAVGLVTFDGAGNWTVNYTNSHDGDITLANSAAGTYTVNSNCTGSMTGAADFAIVILDGGTEVTGVQTDDNVTATLEIKKQNASGCSNATLAGNYALTMAGFGTPPPLFPAPANSSVPTSLGGLATFDGAGNFTASLTLSHNGDIITRPSDTGTYTVSSDCSGTFTDVTAGIHVATVILAGGTEVFGLQTDNGTATTLDAKKQ